jgi:hypothetical protein
MSPEIFDSLLNCCQHLCILQHMRGEGASLVGSKLCGHGETSWAWVGMLNQAASLPVQAGGGAMCLI